MNTRNISIALIVAGCLLYATSGRLFSITPDDWRVFAYKSGHLALLVGLVLALYHGASVLVATLRERLRSDSEKLHSDVQKLNDSNRALTSVIGDFAAEFVATAQDANNTASAAHDLAECQAHFAANTALSAETYGLIADLLVRIGAIADEDRGDNYVATAGKLRKQLARLQVTHNGLSGPTLIQKAEDFIAVHQTACDSNRATQVAERALAAAKTASVTSLTALNEFDA